MLSRLQWLKAVPRPVSVLHSNFTSRNLKSFRGEEIVGAAKPKLKVSSHGSEGMPHVMTDRKYKYSEGQIYNGFKCERIEYIPDFELMSCSLRHIGTGTEFWYIDRKDTNNVFSINFRTTPFDSTGLPHILEHLALCGSKTFQFEIPSSKC